MPKTRWPVLVVLSAAFLALAVFLHLQGLERADMWASVLALFVALATLVTGLLGRRSERGPTSAGTDSAGEEHRVTNHGNIGQVINGDRARARQKNKFYYR